ncbi:MAG: PAC2 family protein, partial [Chloroflexota bacterium]|nr:PAC2 family protein [Chloroflexota bacterium]
MRIGDFEVVEPAPELEDAIAIAMLRPWVDVGNAGTLTLKILERQMTASELGRLARPGKYLDFTRERPVMKWVDGMRSLDIPNSVVNYARDPATGRDFLFLHLREPHMYGEDFCDAVVELVKRFNVVEYCRIGGMYDQVPHTRPLKITGSLQDRHLDRLTGFLAPRRSTYQGPTSIVNLIGEGLEEAGIESSSLMVHLPHYVQLDEDYMATARLLEALC